MKQVTDLSEYQELVERYRRPGVRSNDYLQQEASSLIQQGRLFSLCREKNAFLFVEREVGRRMYYYINDTREVAALTPYTDLVTEILFRSDVPEEEVNYLVHEGFCVNLIRDQYCGVYKDLQGENGTERVVIKGAQTLEQVAEACELFNDSFDRLSGDYIPALHYSRLLDSRSILLALDVDDTHRLLGALHQSRERGVNWISHVAVKAEARGCKIGPALVRAFIENNYVGEKTRYMLWVQHQNEAAVNMYRRMGFKYTNKSTLSLTK